MKHLVLVAFLLGLSSAILAFEGLSIRAVNETTLLAIQLFDESGEPAGYGSGLLLWNYQEEGGIYLLTAAHVFRGAATCQLYSCKSGRAVPVLDSPLDLVDSSGQRRYLTYAKENGQEADAAILPFSTNRLTGNGVVQLLVRSNCLFADSVWPGDNLVTLGYADVQTFDFVATEGPLAVAGCVAHVGRESYLMDATTFDGMSGGVAFKAIPVEGEFGYRAIGLVSSNMVKHPDYSWIVKMDYVDSILVQNTGLPWTGVSTGDEKLKPADR